MITKEDYYKGPVLSDSEPFGWVAIRHRDGESFFTKIRVVAESWLKDDSLIVHPLHLHPSTIEWTPVYSRPLDDIVAQVRVGEGTPFFGRYRKESDLWLDFHGNIINITHWAYLTLYKIPTTMEPPTYLLHDRELLKEIHEIFGEEIGNPLKSDEDAFNLMVHTGVQVVRESSWNIHIKELDGKSYTIERHPDEEDNEFVRRAIVIGVVYFERGC